MGTTRDSILSGKYPGKSHVHRVVSYLRKHSKVDVDNAVIFLESQHTRMNEDNDQASPFRQRRYFYYLTGCELADSAFVYDVKSDKSTLFIPGIDEDEVVWSGLPLSPEEAMKLYDVDDVKTVEQVNSYLNSENISKKAIFAIGKQVSDEITFLSFETKEMESLKDAIEECRVVKDAYEIALTRRANEVSDIAHQAVMKNVKRATNERELAGLFLERCIANGCARQAYDSIVASGTDASTLHYVKNDKPITSKTLNLLLDAGGEYNCYASDVTRTFPVSGRFTKESAEIYSLVLKMQKECMNTLKAGVVWDDTHALAHRIAIDGLLKLGILKGNADEIFEAKTSVAFLPHGLGHYLGMDTHDTGGHPNYQDPNPMYKYLRVRGKLPAGSIITVEPGIYFCRFIIEPFLNNPEQAKYIDKDVLDRYWEVGGVRIEDDVLVTEDGFEDLTTVPKEIEDLENLINS